MARGGRIAGRQRARWTEFLNSPVQPQEIALGESVIDGAGGAVRQSNGKSMLEPIETIARRQWRSHLKLEIRQIDRGCICHVHPVVADKSGFCWNPKLIEGTVQEMTRSPTEVVILNHGARTGQGKPGRLAPLNDANLSPPRCCYSEKILTTEDQRRRSVRGGQRRGAAHAPTLLFGCCWCGVY